MSSPAPAPRPDDPRRLLAIYLRDHLAGSTGGLALARRARRNNAGTPWEDVLASIESELADERRALESTMARLDVQPSRVKTAIGSIAELAGRAKSNGRLFRYSASSRVVELEGLAAGITTKRNLWRSLLAADLAELDASELEALVAQSTSQLDRVLDAHGRAASLAFGGPAAG